MRLYEVEERYLRSGLKRAADAPCKTLLVHIDIVEKRIRRHVFDGIGGNFVDVRLQRRREQRPVHHQGNVRRGLVELHHRPGRRCVAKRKRALLDVPDQLHDPAVVLPCLVVEVAPQLLRQARHGALRHFTRLDPIVVNADETPIRLELLHGSKFEHPRQQLRKFVLARRRHQKIPERTKALALVGIRN